MRATKHNKRASPHAGLDWAAPKFEGKTFAFVGRFGCTVYKNAGAAR
jgi:hypothetical protein